MNFFTKNVDANERQYKQDSMLSELFPGEDIERIISIIKRLRGMIPPTTQDSINYIEEILSYTDAMIHGDDISQFTTKTYVTKYAKNALAEIVSEVHQQTLDAYRQEKSELEASVANLRDEHNSLTSEVDELRDTRIALQRQTHSLSEQIAQHTEKLNQIRKKGISEVENAVAGRKKALQDEVSALSQQRTNLTSAVSSLKKDLNQHSMAVEALESTKKVTWEPIASDNPVYGCNHDTIESHIKALHTEYSIKMEVPIEEAEQEFKAKSPGYYSLKKSLPWDSNISIKQKITRNDYESEQIKAILSTLKAPKYHYVQEPIDIQGVSVNSVPTDIDSLLREFYFQRIAIEAITKKTIAEAELKVVVDILKRVLPPNYDLRSLVHSYGQFNDPTLQSMLTNTTTDQQILTSQNGDSQFHI